MLVTETFDNKNGTKWHISNIEHVEMFYLIEKAYESVKRWYDQYLRYPSTHPGNHPLFPFLEKCSKGNFAIKLPLMDQIREFLVDIEKADENLLY